MNVLTTKNERFALGVTYTEGQAGGTLFYIPKEVLNEFPNVDELQRDHEAFNRLRHKEIEGDTIEELRQEMKATEEELIILHKGIEYAKSNK